MRLFPLLAALAVLAVPAVWTAAAPGIAATDDDRQAAAGADGAEPGDAALIRFNFKDATFEEVVDFFARSTGLPVVWEADPPEGTLSYLSPEAYDMKEALRVLNIILQSRGVMLRVSDDMLYLRRLEDMKRADIPTFVGKLPADITPDQVVSVVRPLENALAKPMAERLAELVAEYGAVTAMEQQNALVITEKAGQIRRLLMMIEELDREDPEGQVEIFSIRHARAADLMEPLTALLAIRVERYVLDQRGEQRRIEEDDMQGLNISHDPRTNSIIARGTSSRIDNLRQAIEMLDVPSTAAGRAIRTIGLSVLSPNEAANRLNQMYRSLDEDRRPTVFALDDFGQVTIVGEERAIKEGVALLREIDGGDGDGQGDDRTTRRMVAVVLEHAEPEAVSQALRGLLNNRQLASTRMVAGPDGRSLVIAGPPGDVEAVQNVIPVLDRPVRVDRQVRVARLTSPEPEATVQRARDLFEKQVDPDDPKADLHVDFDGKSRTITLIGSAAAIDQFNAALRAAEDTVVVDRETRQIELEHATPSRIVQPLTALARQLMEPPGEEAYIEPDVAAIDQLDTLVITARPGQFAVLTSLIETLDRPDPDDYQFRVFPLTGINKPEMLLERAELAWEKLTLGHDEKDMPKPAVRIDELTGQLIVSGRTVSVRKYEQAIGEARQLLPPSREGRMITLRQARAADIVQPLREMLEKTRPIETARTIPQPTIEVVERTNSLYIVAEPVQHQMIERFARELDRVEQADLPPMRLIQVRAADAGQIARLLRERYDSRPQEQRREHPVDVSSDEATNTLVVTAHADLFAEIREFVDEVNRAGEREAERETMIFPLKLARATDVVRALEKLYPEPPMPRDRLGRPMPHLQQPREVHVASDAGTNTLIIEAPTERRASFEALVERLDRVELPPTAELRTYHIKRGDPREIANTLRDLAEQGVLSERGEDGQRIDVTIQVEPTSRTLIVAGDERTFEKTEAVLRDLQAVPVERSLRVFEVTGADPREIAERAQRLYDEQTAEIPEAGEVSVEVDRESSTLLVIADDEAMFRFASIFNELRESIGPPPDVRLVPLEYADAAEVVEFLEGLSAGELGLVSGRAGPKPSFQAIERTNSILIAARSEQHEVIRSLIDSIDKVDDSEMPPLRILQLRTADADNLARALQRQYDQRSADERAARRVNISADANTNALIVAAHPEVLPEIQGIVDELNRADRRDYDGREIRIFPLKIARAEELASTIDEMFPQPPVPRDARGRPMPHLQEQREIVVRADRQTNSLIVDAPVQRMAGFEQIVEQLDRQEIREEVEVRTYAVRFAEIDSITRTLRELAEAGTFTPGEHERRVGITITAEPVSGKVIVAGPAESFRALERVLDDLDQRPAGPETTLRFFRLEHARAQTVAELLREVLLTRIDEEVPDGGAEVRNLLNVTADQKTNTLIISAPVAIMPVAEELIRQLDDSTASIGDPLVRVVPLTFADAGDVSRALQEAAGNIISKVTGEPMDVRITASPGSNAIILVGLEKDLEEIDALIEPLDERPTTDALDARTYALTHADAAAIAPIVQRLLADQMQTDPWLMREQVRQARGQIDLAPQVRVEADERTNSVIVSASQRTVALAEALIEQLDRPDELVDRTYETFTPSRARPEDLARQAERITARTRLPARRAHGRAGIEYISEGQTGSIIVISPEDEAAEAIALLERLDREAIAPPQMDFRIVELEHSEAEMIAQTVAPMLADPARWPEALRAARQAGVDITQPTVTADQRANRLLISAPRELMSVARTLIEELDQQRSDDESVDIRIVGLDQAEAAEVARAVTESVQARFADHPGGRRLSIQHERSSNSVIVTAAPELLAEIESMIASLDRGVKIDQHQVRTVFLRHARAEQVASTMRELLAAEEIPMWTRMQAIQRGQPLPDTGPDVRVTPDRRLNAVVIAAPPAALEVAEQMARSLDQDPAEVDGRAVRSVRVLSVENADVRDLAQTLDGIFDEQETAESAPTIRVDIGSNSLIVRATDEQFATIEEITRSIDRATIATARQMQMIRIDPSRAEAAEVARTLKQLLDRSGGSTVEVISVDELRDRRKGREQPAGSSSAAPTEAVTPGLRAPGFVTDLVSSLLVSVLSAPSAVNLPAHAAFDDEADDALLSAIADDADIIIAVDEASNSLIVIGSPRAIERMADLAHQIQQHMPEQPATVRYVALPETVDARTVTQLVNQTLGQMTPAGGQRGDLRRRVAVLADAANNAVIVTASDHDFETVGDLIAALSEPAGTDELTVKIYPLETVTADRAASSVRNLIQPDAAVPRRGRGQQAQRMRTLAIRLLAEDQEIEAVFDPARISVTPDVMNNALIVMGPAESIGFIDQYIELIDQRRVHEQPTLKMYRLSHARAAEVRSTVQNIFRARFRAMQQQLGRDAIQPEFAVDDRTNTLIVTAAPEQLSEIGDLLADLDQPLGDEVHPLRTIELAAAQPGRAADILRQVVIGTDQQRRSETLIVPDDQSGVLLVRASEEVGEEIDRVLKEIDRDAAQKFEVRTITVKRASAERIAEAVQRFYDDRAQIAGAARGRRAQARQISIVGDEASRTLLVAASDDEFKTIQELVERFDSPEATQTLDFRVFELRHAKATEIRETVQALVNQLTWGQMVWTAQGPVGGPQHRGALAVREDRRLNTLIVTGEGQQFEMVESIIEMLDRPLAEGEQRVVRLYHVERMQLSALVDILREVFTDQQRRQQRWWEPTDPTEPVFRTDERNNLLIVSASRTQHEEIAEMVEEIDGQVAPTDHEMRVLTLEFAPAGEMARTLRQFLADRARATNAPPPSATIIPSDSSNSLIVSAGGDDLATIRDLLGRLDQPDLTENRLIEIIALQRGDADAIARIVRQQFGGERDRGVRVTPDVRTNSLIVNAPRETFARARGLIEKLDQPDASDETVIRTYALEGARAQEAQRILAETLQLDARGRTEGITIRLEEVEGPAVEVKARIVADRRSNSLIVTATPESFPVIESLIRKIDDVPSASPVDYRVIPLRHAMADDVTFSLREMARGFPTDDPQPRIDYNRVENQLIIAATPGQFEQIDRILKEIDKPSERERITEFVSLQFAEAENVQEALSVFYGRFAMEADTPAKRNVRIVADPATNSLVISAEESEWEDIRALLSELDSEEYDSSLQLTVFPLRHADAASVARAINDAFAGEIERGRRGDHRDRMPPRGRDDDDRRDREPPTVLVESQEWVRASAEPMTNSVVVSASRPNQRKIEAIITQLDVADFARLPAPRLIPVRTGNPERVAESLRRLYERTDQTRRGRDALRIVGDTNANAIIVRADEEEFNQIRALAEALQHEAAEQGVSVHVLRLTSAPAGRVASAIRDAYQSKAQQTNQPLSIQIDPQGNSLVIASTRSLFEEIERTVEQLDALQPGSGQGIFIIDLQNISPDAAKEVIETIGLHQRQPEDSATRLVSEPVRVTPLRGRNSLIVVANPADRETVVGLLKAIDAEPEMAEARMRVVKLKNARAEAVVQILERVLRPGEQQAETALARAIREQVRRLAVRRDGVNEKDLHLDLTKPIRLIADPALNAVVVSSTPANVAAVEEVIGMFDTLPVTDAVMVQIFPLQNIAADQFARIARDLFQQGKDLARVPGADLEGVPAGMVGKALLDEVAISVDDRTNTVIVAGKEDAVALVEVLSKRLDSDVATGWVEPRIIRLTHADAGDLAATLQSVLVDGAQNLPQASPMQRQIGRLRMARQGDLARPEQADGDQPRVLEADVFQPMTRLVIRPEPQLNALVLVGTPENLEVVTELVNMLDIEAASPSAAVRIYPVQHASAARLAQTVTRLFDQQVQSKAIRPEDRVIVQADERTNSLIVTTSPRSFAVLESLLDQLDSEVAPDLREIRRIQVEHASAARLAALVQQMMDARLERLRRVQPETAELERATIIAEPRTNSLVIAAGQESFEVIQRFVADLDESTLAEAADVHVLPIEHGNIERLAETISQLMERRYADQPAEIRRTQQPLVLTDTRSSSLLVAANPEDLATIERLIDRLGEAPVSPAVGLHVITLESGVRADQLADRLQRLMRERQQSLGEAATSTDRVSIEPDPGSNSLIVAASRENFQVIEDLLSVIVDADSPGGRDVEVMMLTTSRATEMVALLQDMHVREANRARGDGTVRVTADERLNAVLVSAPRSDVATIRDLVQRLDGTKPSRVVETRFIHLQSANALETVNLIENILSGRGIGVGTRGPQQSTVLKYVRRIAEEQSEEFEEFETEMEVGAAIRESITLTPDVRTNTIIVSAPRESMRMIEQMIRDLDSSSVGSQTVRIFELQNADARAMAEILTDLFSLRRQGSLYVLRPREGDSPAPQEPAGEGAAPLPAGTGAMGGIELTAVPDERQQLAITVDSRTNSLLVAGTPTYLDTVERVIRDLDQKEAMERDVRVYQLRNAVAEEVANVVSTFVEREQEKLISTLGTDQVGSAARLLEREVTIVGDEKSNHVMISASPRYMERVMRMVEQLDIDPPQVLIQVMLAEITLDESFDWGVDFDFRARIDSATVTGGYGLASAFVSGMGVPNLAVASSDFDLLINAMSAQGRLQVLSNPSVMAANNEQARIQVGETIRVPTDVSITDAGRTQTSVEEEQIGVILEVTPSINPDGFVRMVINPEISDLTARTIQISEDFDAPIITRRQAETTVTVYDGQTIVLGGLISDRFERRSRKVPLLGDIPVLGALFRSDSEESTKTELLIVLTPHVIESPAELHRVQEITDREVGRLSLPPEVRRGLIDRISEGGDGIYDAHGNRLDKPREHDEEDDRE